MPVKAGFNEMIFNVEDKPPFKYLLIAALQHLAAVFVGICTPGMVVAGSLNLPLDMTAYLVSISLVSSAFGTFLQVNRFGHIGSGLLSVVGTSFIFPATITAIARGVLDVGGTYEEAMAAVSGVALAGSLVQIGVSFMAPLLKRVFTPLVNGIVVTLIGMTLCRASMMDICGGAALLQSKNPSYANAENVLLGAIVFGIIILISCSKRFMVRASSILIGLGMGYIIAVLWGKVDFSSINSMHTFMVPVPFKYGISFSWHGLFVICLGYLLSCAEAIGDVAACCAITGTPSKGEDYNRRVRGAVFVDGLSSAFSSCFNGMPVCTLSQNNGIIQVTGIASRHAGKLVALFLLILGLCPIIGALFAVIPRPVLGGSTLLLFGSVAAAGYRIIVAQPLDRRSMLILAMSLGAGVGIELVPEIKMNLHPLLQELCHSAVSLGGFIAILGSLLIPKPAKGEETGQGVESPTEKNAAAEQA